MDSFLVRLLLPSVAALRLSHAVACVSGFFLSGAETHSTVSETRASSLPTVDGVGLLRTKLLGPRAWTELSLLLRKHPGVEWPDPQEECFQF